MNKGINYLKENWATMLIFLVFFNWILSLLLEPWRILILSLSTALSLIFSWLSKKVLKLHKSGPIPWYGSPILWLSLFIVVAWIFRHVTYM